jgi:hypothetical protein
LPVANIINILGIIYANSGIFPHDFDWGYADIDVFTPKKFYNIGHWATLGDEAKNRLGQGV